jgi:hypothetical protein
MRLKHYLFICVCVFYFGNAISQEQKPSIADFAWLAGCWDGSGGGRESLEQWIKPSGQTLLGMSRTVANDNTVAYEFLRIHQQDGEIYYTAKPSGQAEASFKLVKYADKEAVFENPQLDFPQRVFYKLEKDGSLAAAIEGMSNGKTKKIDFPMRRAKCDQ